MKTKGCTVSGSPEEQLDPAHGSSEGSLPPHEASKPMRWDDAHEVALSDNRE